MIDHLILHSLEQAGVALILQVVYLGALALAIQREWLTSLELHVVSFVVLLFVTTLAVGRFM